MQTIPCHAVDPELVREGIEADRELLSRVLRSAAERPQALAVLLGTARRHVGYLAAGGEQKPGRRWWGSAAKQKPSDHAQQVLSEQAHALRVGAQAAAAMFALACGEGEVEFPLADGSARLPATGPTSSTHPGTWRVGWWLAHLVGDRASIETLARTPIDVLRRSSSRADECQYLYVEALRGYETRSAAWSTALRAAVDATDPEATALGDEELVLDLLVPEMQLVFRRAIGEVAPFGEALQLALERHKKYWSKPSRARDPDGFVALGPTAICATLSGVMPIAIESPYLPRTLIGLRASRGA